MSRSRRALPAALAALAVSGLVLAGSAAGAADPPPPTRTAAAVAAPASPPPGIYQVWGSDDAVSAPYVRGGQIVLQWRDLEPARGRFDFSRLDAALRSYAGRGKPASVQVNSDTKPAWLWSTIARCGTVGRFEVPQYWDPLYLTIQSELVSALARHLTGSPYARSVALVRASPNAIGTELTDVPGTRCTPAANGRLSTQVWTKEVGRRYYLSVMGLYRDALRPQIPVALRAQLFTTHDPAPPLSWLGLDDAWVMGTASDIDPNPVRDAFDVFAVNWSRAGKTQAYWEPHYSTGKSNLVSWNYWRTLLELHKGVSYVAVYGQEIRNGGNPEYRAAFDFVNRYAGSHATPQTAPGAWVALKQGTGRTAGNLTRHMAQIDPDATSTALDSSSGRSMIGPPTQRFGRYARQVQGGTDRSTMFFGLDPAFRKGVASATTTLRVVYLDRGTGSFAVTWGSGAGASRTVRKTGSGAWRELVVSVPGSSYRGGLARSSDVTLSALGGEATAFHLVEVAVPGR